MYMYSGMADVAALTGDASYAKALDRIWEDVVGTKLYITGGIGATGGNEGFSFPYVLPNMSAYCETCAAIANALWNHRMFLLHGDAKYIDVLERVIYNGFLSGVSMDGDRFFYPNRLESYQGATRSAWFDCACCPTNFVRFVPSIAGYIYAQKGNDLYINLFVGSETTIESARRNVKVAQATRYPWEGRVKIMIDPDAPAEFTLKIRIPGWVRNRPVPSDLYRYLDRVEPNVVIKVNGERAPFTEEEGYASFQRTWRKNDLVEIDFPMPIRRVVANESVEEDRGKVALERGPIVF